MIFLFHLRTTPIHTEEDVKFEAGCLNEAVSKLKRYIRNKEPLVTVIVSYFYFRIDDESIALCEFDRDFYLEHFKEFQDV